jgi:hypothetical protein
MNQDTKFEGCDFRNSLPRFTPEALKAKQTLFDLLAKTGERKTATPAQSALAWLLLKSRGSFETQAPPSWRASRKISGQQQSSLRPRISVKSMAPPQQPPRREPATRTHRADKRPLCDRLGVAGASACGAQERVCKGGSAIMFERWSPDELVTPRLAALSKHAVPRESQKSHVVDDDGPRRGASACGLQGPYA